MYCQPLGKIADGGLGTGISRGLGQRTVSIHGRNIDDIAATVSHHVLGKGLGGDQRTVVVQIKDHIHGFLIQIEEGLQIRIHITGLKILLIGGSPGIIAACTVEKNITGTEIRKDLVCDSFHILLDQHIALISLGNTAFCDDLVRIAVNGFLAAVDQGNLCTCPGQNLCQMAAKHTTSTGDYRHFSCQIGCQHVFFHSSIPISDFIILGLFYYIITQSQSVFQVQ